MNAASILIVDDDPALAAVIEASLQQAGYTVSCADGAETALDLLAKNKISAVITDLRMPVTDGLGLLARMRAAGIHIPSILLTGAGEFTHADARASGVSAFLVKPLAGGELVRVLAAVLAQNNPAK